MSTPFHSCSSCQVKQRSVFQALSDEELAGVNQHKACACYKKGQFIFTENGLPMALYCVHSGKVKITRTGLDGKEQIVRLAKAGDILGYRAIVTNERYQCSAIAIEDASLCIIDKNYFFETMEKNSKFSFEILKKIGNDLKTAESQIVSLSQKNIRERMAEALLFLKATYGFEDDQQTLNVSFSREEIADFAGTSTESAIRLLSEFSQDQLIERDGKKIKILDLSKLIKTANIID